MEIRSAIELWAQKFDEAKLPSARLDARLLVLHATGCSYEDIIRDPDLALTEDQTHALEAICLRRLAREPIAQIVGQKEFWKHSFLVTKDVLTPRPDTEILVETAVKYAPSENSTVPVRIADLGTGSGCILLSLVGEIENSFGLGLDRSLAALQIAQRNSERLGFSDRTHFICSSWGTGVNGPFDLIVANPPYIMSNSIKTLEADIIDYEPHEALDGGSDGLDPLREIIRDLDRILAKNGTFLCEFGVGQRDLAISIVETGGFNVLDVVPDLNAIDRVIVVQRP